MLRDTFICPLAPLAPLLPGSPAGCRSPVAGCRASAKGRSRPAGREPGSFTRLSPPTNSRDTSPPPTAPGGHGRAPLRPRIEEDQVVGAPLDQLRDGLDAIQVALADVHDTVQATYFPPLAPAPDGPGPEPFPDAGRASEPSDAASVREPGRDTTHMEAHLVPHDRPVDGRHDMAVDLAALPPVGPAAPLPEPDGL